MSRIHRIGVVLIALVAVVAAFVLLQPGEDPKATATAAGADAPATTSAVATPTTTSAPQAPPAAPLLTAGRVRTISVEHGDTVRCRVRSSVAEEVHVHGYDIGRTSRPGRTGPYRSGQARGQVRGRVEHTGSRSLGRGRPVKARRLVSARLAGRPQGRSPGRPASAHGLVGRSDLPIPRLARRVGAPPRSSSSRSSASPRCGPSPGSAPRERVCSASRRGPDLACGAIGVASSAGVVYAGLEGADAPRTRCPRRLRLFWVGTCSPSARCWATSSGPSTHGGPAVAAWCAPACGARAAAVPGAARAVARRRRPLGVRLARARLRTTRTPACWPISRSCTRAQLAGWR